MTENCPLVSIGVITYNQRNYIRQCIESCLAQDYPNLELVIADDASSDGTQDILREYKIRYPELIKLLISGINKGITENSNMCLRGCTGKYISMIGGDDIFLPEKTKKQVEILEKNKNIAICGTYTRLIDRNGEVIGQRKDLKKKKNPKYSKRELIESGNSVIPVCSYMFKSNAIPNEMFDTRIGVSSDSLFFVRVSDSGEIYVIKEFLAMYRVHASHAKTLGYNNNGDGFVTRALLEFHYPECIRSINISRSRLYFNAGVSSLRDGKHKNARIFFSNALSCKWKIKYLGALLFSILPIRIQSFLSR